MKNRENATWNRQETALCTARRAAARELPEEAKPGRKAGRLGSGKDQDDIPIASVNGIFTYIYKSKNQLNVGRYVIHGW